MWTQDVLYGLITHHSLTPFLPNRSSNNLSLTSQYLIKSGKCNWFKALQNYYESVQHFKVTIVFWNTYKCCTWQSDNLWNNFCFQGQFYDYKKRRVESGHGLLKLPRWARLSGCRMPSIGGLVQALAFWILSCNASQRGFESWSLDNWGTYCKTKHWFDYHLWKQILSIDGQNEQLISCVVTWKIVIDRELTVFQMKTASQDIFLQMSD